MLAGWNAPATTTSGTTSTGTTTTTETTTSTGLPMNDILVFTGIALVVVLVGYATVRKYRG